MKNRTIKFLLLFFCCLCSSFPAFSSDIVVTSRPIYSIVKNISCGLKVQLIGKNGVSPHEIQLKPSELKSMIHSKMVIVTSPNLETSLLKILKKHDQLSSKIILAQDAPNMALKHFSHRKEINSQGSEHSHHHNCHNHDHHHHDIDPHFWLNISNAIYITKYLSKEMSVRFPDYKTCITKKTASYIKSLNILQKKIDTVMRNSNVKNVIVSHDALSYFLDPYGINVSGVIVTNFHTPPSLKTLTKLKNIAKTSKKTCILLEERFNSQPIQNSFKEVNVKMAFFDPEWGPTNIDDKEIYSKLMMNNAIAISNCLSIQPEQ